MKFFGIILGLKNAQLKRGLEESRKDVEKFKQATEKGGGIFGGLGRGIGGLAGNFAAFGGAAGAAGFLAWLKNGVSFAGDLKDKADQLGVTVERLQAINDVLADAGVNPEQAEKGIQSLTMKMTEAVEGSESAQKAFAALGISMDEVLPIAADSGEAFLRVAEGYSKAADKGKALIAVQELFGRPGKKMVGAFGEGAKPFREAEKGLIVSDKEAGAADKLGDRAAKAGRKMFSVLPGKLAGMVAQVIEKVTDPNEWKNNLTGAQRSYWAKKEGKDPDAHQLEGLTDWQRSQVEHPDYVRNWNTRFRIDPEQARKMRPGMVEPQKSPDQIAKEKQIQDTKHADDAAAATAATAREEANKKFNAENSRAARLAQFKKRAAFLADRAANTTGATQAEAQGELAGLMRDRQSELADYYAMNPNERREANRAAGRRARGQSRAARQVEREAREELRKGGGEKKSDPALKAVESAVKDVDNTLKSRLSAPSS